MSLETAVAQNFGGISRNKNTRRLFVGPGMIDELATTGTWVLQQTSNVPELFTTDASTTNILGIPFPGEYADFAAEGSGAAIDRGIRILGVELLSAEWYTPNQLMILAPGAFVMLGFLIAAFNAIIWLMIMLSVSSHFSFAAVVVSNNEV